MATTIPALNGSSLVSPAVSGQSNLLALSALTGGPAAAASSDATQMLANLPGLGPIAAIPVGSAPATSTSNLLASLSGMNTPVSTGNSGQLSTLLSGMLSQSGLLNIYGKSGSSTAGIVGGGLAAVLGGTGIGNSGTGSASDLNGVLASILSGQSIGSLQGFFNNLLGGQAASTASGVVSGILSGGGAVGASNPLSQVVGNSLDKVQQNGILGNLVAGVSQSSSSNMMSSLLGSPVGRAQVLGGSDQVLGNFFKSLHTKA